MNSHYLCITVKKNGIEVFAKGLPWPKFLIANREETVITDAMIDTLVPNDGCPIALKIILNSDSRVFFSLCHQLLLRPSVTRMLQRLQIKVAIPCSDALCDQFLALIKPAVENHVMKSALETALLQLSVNSVSSYFRMPEFYERHSKLEVLHIESDAIKENLTPLIHNVNRLIHLKKLCFRVWLANDNPQVFDLLINGLSDHPNLECLSLEGLSVVQMNREQLRRFLFERPTKLKQLSIKTLKFHGHINFLLFNDLLSLLVEEGPSCELKKLVIDKIDRGGEVIPFWEFFKEAPSSLTHFEINWIDSQFAPILPDSFFDAVQQIKHIQTLVIPIEFIATKENKNLKRYFVALPACVKRVKPGFLGAYQLSTVVWYRLLEKPFHQFRQSLKLRHTSHFQVQQKTLKKRVYDAECNQLGDKDMIEFQLPPPVPGSSSSD